MVTFLRILFVSEFVTSRAERRIFFVLFAVVFKPQSRNPKLRQKIKCFEQQTEFERTVAGDESTWVMAANCSANCP